jgi:hypothetical protein
MRHKIPIWGSNTVMCQHFSGHNVKWLCAAIRSLLGTNRHWLNAVSRPISWHSFSVSSITEFLSPLPEAEFENIWTGCTKTSLANFQTYVYFFAETEHVSRSSAFDLVLQTSSIGGDLIGISQISNIFDICPKCTPDFVHATSQRQLGL